MRSRVEPVAGSLLAGRYRLGESLDRAVSGHAFLAHDEVADRPVTVEILETEQEEATPSAVRRQVRTAARISHPGMARVLDLVDHDDRSWVVTEHVAAPTLEQLVSRSGPLDEQVAARLGVEILDALSAALAGGADVRDVRPSTVLVTEDGRAVLIGIGVPRPHVVDPYVSPEIVNGRRARGLRSDLWSLGATLYAAVHGVPPGRNGSTPEGALDPVLAGLLVDDPVKRPPAEQVRRVLHDLAGLPQEDDGSVDEPTAVMRRPRPDDRPAARVEMPLPPPAVTPPLPATEVPAENAVEPPTGPVDAEVAVALAALDTAISDIEPEIAANPAHPAPETPGPPAADADEPTAGSTDTTDEPTTANEPTAETPTEPTVAHEPTAETPTEPTAAESTPTKPTPTEPTASEPTAAEAAVEADEPAAETTAAEPAADLTRAEPEVAQPVPAEEPTAPTDGPAAEPDVTESTEPAALADEPATPEAAAEEPEPAAEPALPESATAPTTTRPPEPAFSEPPPVETERGAASVTPLHPVAPVVPPARRRGRRALLVAAVAVLLAALVAVPVVLVRGRGEPAAAPGATATNGSGSSAPGSQTPSPRAATAPPSDWQLYRESDGYYVGIPKGWGRTVADDTVVWKEPGSAREVRVRTIVDPKVDPYDYWLDNQFGVTESDGYDFDRIAPVVYRGWPTADWTYRTGLGADKVHVITRLVRPGGPRAYIITFTTADSRWPADRRYFDTVTGTFGLDQ